MKTSTEIGSISRNVGEERAIEYIAKAGFDAWDFSMFKMHDSLIPVGNQAKLIGSNYLKFVRHLKQIGLDNGIHCNQSHAPYPSFNKKVKPYLQRAIECTAEAGANICIIHPGNNNTIEENTELYLELLPFAKEYGVKIACENMWNWDYIKHHAVKAACSNHQDFLNHIKAVNDDYLVACLDIGHAEMKGLNTSAVDMIYTLGDHLQALHIHDNDKWHDSHQIPFSMKVDFPAILKALKDIGYNGYFTLECSYYMYFYGIHNAYKGVEKLAKSARKLANMYENL